MTGFGSGHVLGSIALRGLLACCFALWAWSGLAFAESPRVVASTDWAAALARLAGAEQVAVIAPAGLQHPPEYEPRPSDLLRVAQADWLVLGGFEHFAERLRAAVGANGQTIEVRLDYRPEIVARETRRLAVLFGDSARAEEHLARYQSAWEAAARQLRAHQPERPVRALTHRFMHDWAELAGVETVAEFRPGPPPPSALVRLAKTEADVIIDNAHAPGGKELAAAAALPHVVLRNFPGPDRI